MATDKSEGQKKKRHHLITNYGLFWERDKVVWGKGGQGNQGHLKGVRTKTDRPVDFRQQQGVYCLYDDNFRLVYVGQSGKSQQRLFSRLKAHTKGELSRRWTKFSWFGIRQVTKAHTLRPTKDATHPKIGDVLNHIEAILIAATEPVHNSQSGKFGKGVQRYLQYEDIDNLEPDIHKKIDDMLTQMKRLEKKL